MNSNCQPFIKARDFLLAHRTDYATATRDFQWPQLSEFNWALDYFDAMAEGNQANALWIVEEDGSEQRYSFQQLAARSNQVANHLRALGVRRGERILLMLGNDVALWETMLAAFKLGAVVIPATALLTCDDLADRIERGQVRHLVVGAAHVDKFDGLGEGCSRVCVGPAPAGWTPHSAASEYSEQFDSEGRTLATDPMLLYFTSGTTSKPKMVLHSHQSYPVGHLSTMYWIGLQPGDLHLNISSPGWAKHAWSCLFAPWNAGACIFIHNVARFSAPALLGALERYGVTSLCAPPTVWRMMIQEDLASYKERLCLRELVGAGEPLNPEIIEQILHAWDLPLRDGFGQSETTALVGNTPGQLLKPGSMGRPLPGYRVTMLDPDGAPGNEGEVALPLDVRPLGLMLCYEDSPEKTAEVMRDGYYRTGDTAQIDDDGYVTFVGRADDVFKASDYRISPFELESALIEHPAVMECAVVPSPDPLRLAVPKAFLILAHDEPGSAELAGNILAFAREHLAPYKRVRRIEFVTELPKTISGKIRRVELRQMEVQRRQSDARGAQEYFEEDFPQLKG
ncbi:AMP-binding protein [Pseudomonas umsongensis]|uniref:AMP-binding protein n=1 Tax=Pseudomonas umsongensis TaxID=198618 RepID=A0AAE7DDR2_9PSED|nr:AMP-binding protein [Pseudomonas umsongensis]KEX90454.1 AMP-dependent synthetase [Pseudomonas putida]OXR28049.1 AMP-dependent synthetase [Pseudomonas umsongensis]QFG29220.1 AMP-binding protein [Pseudomonas umsongensis]QJC78749.1 AMP-binding protein [Pseudomonas umsongensis]SDS78378.1 acetyl-CoA synthetase [Pseudomonas umsongensis]